jgi:hypothetical protein
LDEGGKTFVVQAGPRYEVLLENEVMDMFWARQALLAMPSICVERITFIASNSDRVQHGSYRRARGARRL